MNEMKIKAFERGTVLSITDVRIADVVQSVTTKLKDISVAASVREHGLRRTGNAAGRPKKNGDRYRCGKRKIAAREAEALLPVLKQRKQHSGLSDKYLRDPLAGYAFGRLKLREEINMAQFDSGAKFAGLIMRAKVHGGFHTDFAKASAVYSMAGGSLGSFFDPDNAAEDTANAIKAEKAFLSAANKVIDALGYTEGRLACSILRAVLLDDSYPDRQLNPRNVTLIRSALNVLGRHFKIMRG